MAAEHAESDSAFSLRALGTSAVLLVAAGLLGQLLAVVRTIYIAARVGTAPELDALLVAEVAPTVITGLLVSGLRAALVPAYAELELEQGPDAARRFVGAIVTWTALSGLLLMTVLMMFPSVAVDLVGPGLSPAAHSAAVRFQPVLAPILVFFSLAAVMTTLCQVNGRFAPVAVTLATAPLVSLFVTVCFWDNLGLNGLALGMTLGYAANLAVAIVYVARVGLLPPVALRVGVGHLGRFVRHALPLTLGAGVLQFNLVADRAVATLFAKGGVSALNYGQLVVLQPLAAVTNAWTTVLYPALVRVAHRGASSSLGATTDKALRYTLVVFVPIAAAVAALAPLVVSVVYQRGAFDAHSAALTSGVVAAFSPMLLFTMVQPILNGAHNARRRGMLLGLAAVVNAILNFTLNIAFGLVLGVAGVALSTSITVGLLIVWLSIWLARTEPGFQAGKVVAVGWRSCLASLAPALPLSIVAWNLVPSLSLAGAAFALATMLSAGMVGYLLGARLLGLTEARDVLRLLGVGLGKARRLH